MKKKSIFLGLIIFAIVFIVLYIVYINSNLNEISEYAHKKIVIPSTEARTAISIMNQVLETLDQKYNEASRGLDTPISVEKLYSKNILANIDSMSEFSKYIREQIERGEEQKRKLFKFTSELEQDINKKINSIKNFIISKYCNKTLNRLIENIRNLESGYNEILLSLSENGRKYQDNGEIVLNKYLSSIEEESKPIFDLFFLVNLRDGFFKSNHNILLNRIIKYLDAKIDLVSRIENKTLGTATMTQNDFNLIKTLMDSDGNEKYKNYAKKILNSVVEIVSVRFENRREGGYPELASFGCPIIIKNHASFPINVNISVTGNLEIKAFTRKSKELDAFLFGIVNEACKINGHGFKLDEMITNAFNYVNNFYNEYKATHVIENIPANGKKNEEVTLWSNYTNTYIGFSGKMKNFKLNVESWEPAIHDNWRE